MRRQASKRQAGDSTNYIRDPRGALKCRDCFFEVRSRRVLCRVNDEFGQTGEMRLAVVHYCPICDDLPVACELDIDLNDQVIVLAHV